ncbi:hypothetical protein GCM10010532_091650 [Dactylosporangium siamense]|uniref:Uncharacterized protein n=1 Tax=Dactylosporangium siamense TaxID=685454 RepID=A0A919PXW2_9ACTN|nr:hypothetical protein Dsi01nite_104520 [Dactylosporangium siamense]
MLGAAHEVDDDRSSQKPGTVNGKIEMCNNFNGVLIGRAVRPESSPEAIEAAVI